MGGSAVYAAAAAAASVWVPSAARADQWFDNGGGDSNYTTATNWASTVPAEDDNVPDASGENAIIRNGFTVNLSGVVTPSELQVSRGGSPDFPQTLTGTARLNVLTGADLQALSTNGIRIGRVVQSGAAAGDSHAEVHQTGGLLQINSGTNGLRLSQADSNIVADSLYRISGGSVRGGPTNLAMTAPLQIGSAGSTPTTFSRAEFHVVGSGPSEIRFEDIRIGGNTGTAVIHFSLDSTGAETMIAEDELRFVTAGANELVVDAIAQPPQADITLIQADRLGTAFGRDGGAVHELRPERRSGRAVRREQLHLQHHLHRRVRRNGAEHRPRRLRRARLQSRRAHPGTRFGTIANLNRAYVRLRRVKSDEEIDWLCLGAWLSDLGMAGLRDGLEPGLDERELGDLIERAYVRHGGTNVIHYIGVTSMRDPQLGVPAQFPSTRRVQAGDIVFAEISAAFWDHPGQVLRSFALGAEPPPLYRELHAAADAAFDAVAGVLRHGATPAQVVEARA